MTPYSWVRGPIIEGTGGAMQISNWDDYEHPCRLCGLESKEDGLCSECQALVVKVLR